MATVSSACPSPPPLAPAVPAAAVALAPASAHRAFVVTQAGPRDAAALSELYEQDYLEGHRQLHEGPAGRACGEAWRSALGPIDFDAVLGEAAANRNTGDVRLLKCVEVSSGCVVGYVLYELREKGSKTRRQRFCELVNIVVRKDRQSCGAGRRLFEAVCADLSASATTREQSADMRLFVAERNEKPLLWYRRLGFTPAGWQSEKLNSTEVKFMRMARRLTPKS